MRAAGTGCPKVAAPTLLARALSFARTGPNIATIAETILRSLGRAKLVASMAGQVRTLRQNA